MLQHGVMQHDNLGEISVERNLKGGLA